jgi:hypothetical protein
VGAEERHRRDADENLGEQPSVGELPDEVAAADEPDVLARGRFGHPLVYGRDIALDERDRRSGDRRQLRMREHPARRVAVEAPPLRRIVERALVLQHPLVRRSSHRHRADLREERGEGVLAAGRALDLEKPLERVALVRDVSVERRRGVVLRLPHVIVDRRSSHLPAPGLNG